MVEPLIRWLKFLQKGYTLTSNRLNLSSKWYADDATLVAHNVTDLNTQLEIVNTFSEWSGIGLDIYKCRLTGYIYELQSLKRKKDRDSALQARLANIRVGPANNITRRPAPKRLPRNSPHSLPKPKITPRMDY
jgi:hypothetical protein